MSDTTKIQWADASFSPWIGCTKVSPGCKNCYAENTTRARVLRSQGHETWGKGAQRSRTSDATWRKPLQWNRTEFLVCETCGTHQGGASTDEDGCDNSYCSSNAKRDTGPYHNLRVFPSLCDWLDDEVPIEWLADFLKLIHDTPNLTWILLTKRPENFKERLCSAARASSWADPMDVADKIHAWAMGEQAWQNVWILTSVENQQMADKRILELLKIPAVVRGLSVEPMLEEIDLRHWMAGQNWVIYGGESGSNARPCNIDWIRDGVRQCKAAGVPVFVKQLGSAPVLDPNGVPDEWEMKQRVSPGYAILDGKKTPVFKANLKDKKGGDMAEWPEDLRVREFP